MAASWFSAGKGGQADAVAALLRLLARCKAATGAGFYFAANQDFARDIDGQVRLLWENYFRASSGSVYWDGSWWQRRPGGVLVATPGTSKHARGLAADLTFESPAARTWFVRNSPSDGWDNEGLDFMPPESWHKSFFGATPSGPFRSGELTSVAGSPCPTPIKDEDMPLTKADVDAVVVAVFNTNVTDAPNGAPATLSTVLKNLWKLGNLIYDDTPARVWGHTLPHVLSGEPTRASDMLRYEALEHLNTRTVVSAMTAADVDEAAIAAALRADGIVDENAIAVAAADEADRRERLRLQP